MDNEAYLKQHLIAYIGNKRSLQPFLKSVFQSLQPQGGVFLDPFAGSGAVSRLAKSLGFKVYANDWEPYAALMNRVFLTLEPQDIPNLYKTHGGIEAFWNELNLLKEPQKPYLAQYYAPPKNEGEDYRIHRLFYTHRNALWLDAVRERIEDLYPGSPSTPLERKEKDIALACLVYEASVHSNTSGVFKACHKGFGGHSKDALTRIMAQAKLELPIFYSGEPCEVHNEDAQTFVKGIKADICYLDPPYNQHQYGSNYHLLNTITLWDKPQPSGEMGQDGKLKDKAGIRKDWNRTRSNFCYRKTAPKAFSELLDQIDAHYIIVSYNTEGIVDFQELYEILAQRGKVELEIRDYVTYRGGRQSLNRNIYNLELLLIVDTLQKDTGACRDKTKRFILEKHLNTLSKASFIPDRLKKVFDYSDKELQTPIGQIKTLDFYKLINFPTVANCSDAQILELSKKLEAAKCSTHEEEARILLELLMTDPSNTLYQKRLLIVLRKFAFKKYADQFFTTLQKALNLAESKKLFTLKQNLSGLGNLAERRIKG